MRELHAEAKRALAASTAGRSATSAARRTPTPTASSTRRWTVPDGDELTPRADRPRRRHRPRPPQGRRRRPRARLLLRRPRLRADAALRRRRGLRLRRRLPPPHRPQHLAVEGRLAAAARHHRPLPRGDPLPDPARARRRAAAPGRGAASRSTAPPTTASARRSTCDDPDGNGVELYWDRPQEEWPQPRPGEKVEMFTRPLDLDVAARRAAELGRRRAMEVAIAGGHGQDRPAARRAAWPREGHAVRGLIRNPDQEDDLHAVGVEPVLCDLERRPDDVARRAPRRRRGRLRRRRRARLGRRAQADDGPRRRRQADRRRPRPRASAAT